MLFPLLILYERHSGCRRRGRALRSSSIFTSGIHFPGNIWSLTHQSDCAPLEREDLPFIHQLDNNASVMRYWFEEPYEAFVELTDLYDKHIHDQSERRFYR